MTAARVPLATIRRLWADRSITRREAAARLGVHPATLTVWARELGLGSRRKPDKDEDLRRLWADARLGTAEIARILGVTRTTVQRRARALGLPHRSHARVDHAAVDWPRFEEMWRDGVSLKAMAGAFGRRWQTISRMAARRGLPSRRGTVPAALTLDDHAQLRLGRAMAARAREEQAALRLAEMVDKRSPQWTDERQAA